MSLVRVSENSVEYDGGDGVGSTSLGQSPIEVIGFLKRSHGHGESSLKGQVSSSSRSDVSAKPHYHPYEIDPENEPLSTDFNKVNRSVRPEKNPQETSTFKFNISRLPKWVQSKATNSENAQ